MFCMPEKPLQIQRVFPTTRDLDLPPLHGPVSCRLLWHSGHVVSIRSRQSRPKTCLLTVVPLSSDEMGNIYELPTNSPLAHFAILPLFEPSPMPLP